MTPVVMNHTNNTVLYDSYANMTQAFNTTIINFVKNIKGTYLNASMLNFSLVQNCQETLCDKFVNATGLTAPDYYLYSAFIDAVLDPMMALHNQDGNPLFGYSLGVFQNNTYANDIWNEL
jgi:hypothetical protein